MPYPAAVPRPKVHDAALRLRLLECAGKTLSRGGLGALSLRTLAASVGTSTGTTFSNTGLTASTSYRYQVRARDAANNMSAFSPAVTVTTSPGTGDVVAPTVPGTPTASGTTASTRSS